MRNCLLLFALVFVSKVSYGQEKMKIKYGNVLSTDFVSNYSIDSSAEAVVLFDKGEISFSGNVKGQIQFELVRHKRIHILKNSGFNYADVSEIRYTSGRVKDKIDKIEATTYNLENGKVINSDLNPDGIFEKIISKNVGSTTFTLPKIKEGSIIEYKYRVTSVYTYDLRPWEFQSEIPVLYSEIATNIPEFYRYVVSNTSAQPFYLNSINTSQSSLRINVASDFEASDWLVVNFKNKETIYAYKDIPALKQENFISSMKNYIYKMDFQLAETLQPLSPKLITNSWEKLTKEYTETDDYKDITNKSNKNVISLLSKIDLTAATTDEQKAKIIYNYVRDNFNSNENTWGIYLNDKINKIIESKTGSNVEINGLLIALLNTAGLESSPVILSLRERGYVNKYYPLLDKFNYLVASVKINGSHIFLDPASKYCGFGVLPQSCYNGYSRLISSIGKEYDLSPDSIQEREVISISLEPKGNELVGKFECKLNNINSFNTRKNKGKSSYIDDLKNRASSEIEMSNEKYDKLDKLDEAVMVTFDLKMQITDDSTLYINPSIFGPYYDNPFKKATRKLPVEFPFLNDEMYVYKITIPDGYTVKEIPKAQAFAIDKANAILYEFRCSEAKGTITLRSRIRFNASTFIPEAYNSIRDIFSEISKKNNELIVLTKK